MVTFEDFTGFTNGFITEEDFSRISFFKPYQSKSDFCFRAITVVSAPIVYTVGLCSSVFYAAMRLIAALHETFTSTKGESKQWDECGDYLYEAAVCLFGAVISPFINAAYLVGGGIGSLSSEVQPDSDDKHFRN